MKAIKKILLAILLVALTATAGGCEIIRGIINLYDVPAYSQRVYVEPDKEEIDKILEEITALCAENGKKQEVAAKRSTFYTHYYQALTSRLVAELEYYKNVNDDGARQRAQNIEKYFNELNNSAIEMEKTVLTSQYASIITETAGQEYANSILNRPTKTDELLALEARESELENEYATLYSGSETRDEAFRNSAANLLKELVVVRNQIAALNKKADGTPYSNYHEYAYAEIYGRDYTPSDAAIFRESIAENLYDIGKKLNEASSTYITNVAKSVSLSEYGLKELMPEIITETASSMLSPWNYMISLGLYDFASSANKLDSSFVVEFQQYGDGFMFVNSSGSLLYDLNTVIHEFGHYNAIFAADSTKENSQLYSYDLAETHSQCFELITLPAVRSALSARELDYVYSAYVCNTLLQSVWSMLSNSIFDEFEYIVYSANESELTRDFFESTFDTVWNKYWTKKSYDYYDITHLYRSPSYCISYSVSMVFSSEIWATENAVDNYLEVVSYGQGNYISTVAEAVGLSNPFSAEAVAQVATKYKNEISNVLGITFAADGGTFAA